GKKQKEDQVLEPGADLYENLHKYQEAQTLREASLALREQTNGKNSAGFAEGLVLLGKLAEKRGDRAEALNYYTRAVELGDRPEVFHALLQLGMLSAKQNLDQAFDYLRRARNVAPNGDDAGRAMTWAANMKALLPENSSEAESLYQAAISTETFKSPQQATTMEFYARFLKQQGRIDEADRLSAQAQEIWKSRVSALSARTSAGTNAYKVGAGVTSPSLLSKVEPSYSEDARAAKIAGVVMLRVVIDTDGIAKDAVVVEGLGYGLDEKAIEAVSKWKFKPGTLAGEPVPVQAQIEINFKLL